MKTRRQLTEDLAREEALCQEEMQEARRLRSELEYEKARSASATDRAQELADQLRQVTESRSLEIRTEALKGALWWSQHHKNPGDILPIAHRYEQYLAKGVTLPTETPNLTTALGLAQGVLTQMTEQLDEGYGHQIQALFEALQWAGRVQQENIELELGQQEREAAVRGLVDQNQKLEREVHDQANEIAEKTARLSQLDQENQPLLKSKLKDADEPVATQYVPSAQEVKASVVSLVGRYVGSASLRGEVEAALAWVEEGDVQNRLHALSLSEGNFGKAKVIDSLLSED